MYGGKATASTTAFMPGIVGEAATTSFPANIGIPSRSLAGKLKPRGTPEALPKFCFSPGGFLPES